MSADPTEIQRLEHEALTALRAAQGKLQLPGKLLDAFKDEEAKLVRQAEEKKYTATPPRPTGPRLQKTPAPA